MNTNANDIMKVAVKTLKKIVLEVSRNELESKGFDSIWDDIRKNYPPHEYDILMIEETSKNGVMFFELVPKA